MLRDLSLFPGTIGNLLETGYEPGPYLAAEDVENYFENGFLSGVPILSVRQLEALRSSLSALMMSGQEHNPLFYEYNRNESSDHDSVLFHALGAWRVSEPFHDLIFHPKIVRIAEQLLGTKVRFWHDQLFVKPAGDGAVVAWHQDYSYWTRTKPMRHITFWIGLDDSGEDNGCVHYVPGSHKWDLLPRTDLANDMDAVLSVLSEDQRKQFRPVPSISKAGEASVHHPMMLHGSYENRSPRPRRAVVLNYVSDGVVSDSDEPLLSGIPVIPRGERLNGQFFPLVS